MTINKPKILKPFFSFFGAKHNLAKHYNKPEIGIDVKKYDTIVEPFCGSACFSLHHYEKNIILYEKDPKIFSVWKFLTDKYTTEDMIHSLDFDPAKIVNLEDLDFIKHVGKEHAEGARNLIGFWLTRGSTNPRMKPTGWAKKPEILEKYPGSFWSERTRIRIASQLEYIKHWKVFEKSYSDLTDKENIEATWFVDPPYSTPAGSAYVYNLRKEEYEDTLAPWCMKRKGQVIVCEQDTATWLDFKEFKTIKSTYTFKGEPGSQIKKESKEVVCYIKNGEVL